MHLTVYRSWLHPYDLIVVSSNFQHFYSHVQALMEYPLFYYLNDYSIQGSIFHGIKRHHYNR